MSEFRIRQDVETPHGKGSVQGGWQGGKVLVRVPVTDENKSALKFAETKNAKISALWAFDGRELRAA
jgi:hypothetical protein